jgi:hypothetical protein
MAVPRYQLSTTQAESLYYHWHIIDIGLKLEHENSP